MRILDEVKSRNVVVLANLYQPDRQILPLLLLLLLLLLAVSIRDLD